MQMRIGVWIAACCMLAPVACSNQGGGLHEKTGATSEAVSGGDAHDVTGSTQLPYAAVGWFNTTPTAGSCSGSVFERDHVLAAAHCFCNNRNPTPGTLQFRLPQAGGSSVTLPIISVATNASDWSAVCNNGAFHSEESTATDLSVLVLSRNLTATELAVVLPVYTGSDFYDRARNFYTPPGGSPFLSTPWEVTGFSGTPRRTTGTLNNISFDNDCDIFGNDCSPLWIDAPYDSDITQTNKGDSGGPLTFYLNGKTPTIFGVISGFYYNFGSDNEDLYSATWENGRGNGKWILGFINDADHDGVDDSVDNCAPQKIARCLRNPDLCSNPNQLDADGDLVGDVCDNCAPSQCVAAGLPSATCADPTQADTDKDSIGDVCDSCPIKPNADGQLQDDDSDGVGQMDGSLVA